MFGLHHKNKVNKDESRPLGFMFTTLQGEYPVLWELKMNPSNARLTHIYQYQFRNHYMDSVFWVLDCSSMKVIGRGLMENSPWYNSIHPEDSIQGPYIEAYLTNQSGQTGLWKYTIDSYFMNKVFFKKIDYFDDSMKIVKTVFYDRLSPIRQ